MNQDAAYRQVRWRSRRGMLELDLLLVPFAERVYPALGAGEQAAYRRLLECEDRDLSAWLLLRVRPRQKEFAALVDKILEHAGPTA